MAVLLLDGDHAAAERCKGKFSHFIILAWCRIRSVALMPLAWTRRVEGQTTRPTQSFYSHEPAVLQFRRLADGFLLCAF